MLQKLWKAPDPESTHPKREAWGGQRDPRLLGSLLVLDPPGVLLLPVLEQQEGLKSEASLGVKRC